MNPASPSREIILTDALHAASARFGTLGDLAAKGHRVSAGLLHEYGNEALLTLQRLGALQGERPYGESVS